MGRKTYSATALCVEPVKAIKIEKDSFLEKLAQYPSSESLPYKRLAQMLGAELKPQGGLPVFYKACPQKYNLIFGDT